MPQLIGEGLGGGDNKREFTLRRGAARRLGRRLFRSFTLTATALVMSAALMTGDGQSAKAEPPLTVAEAKARIAQLETDAEAIDQEYIEISEQLRGWEQAQAQANRPQGAG